MTAHNDKIEAVTDLFLRMSEGAHRPISKWQASRYAEGIVSFMEQQDWLKADASRSVSLPDAAGREHSLHRIKSALRYPYDAAWKDGESGGVPAISDPDYVAARAIINDIQDRARLKWEWAHVDYDVRVEIVATFADIIKAARSESEDTQQAEGAANPSNQLQELIEAAEALDNRIVDYALSIDNLGIAGSRELDAFRAALQNVKGF